MLISKLKTMLEALKKVTVVRNNVPTEIQVSTKPNYKIVDGQEVKMSLEEILNRRKAAKKSALKKTAQQENITDKRNKSIEKREEKT